MNSETQSTQSPPQAPRTDQAAPYPSLWTDCVADNSSVETAQLDANAVTRRTKADNDALPPSPPALQSEQLFDPVAQPSKLGEQFISAGLLTPEQVQHIIDWQRRNGLRFGEAAVQLGLLSQAQVQAAIETQFHYSTAAESHPTTVRLPIAHNPYGAEAEAIRQIRAELILRLTNPRKLSLSVISPNEHEGKSYLASSLAVAFAQTGRNTLLINANLRVSGQASFPGIDNETGLSSMLAGRTTPAPGQPFPGFQRLYVLNSGPPPPNPLEILQGLHALIQGFHAQFDVIVVDTPAALLSADAQVIANQTDACLIVARQDYTQIKDLNRTRQLLSTAGATVIGTVLNVLPLRTPSRGLLGRILRGWRRKGGPVDQASA